MYVYITTLYSIHFIEFNREEYVNIIRKML